MRSATWLSEEYGDRRAREIRRFGDSLPEQQHHKRLQIIHYNRKSLHLISESNPKGIYGPEASWRAPSAPCAYLALEGRWHYAVQGACGSRRGASALPLARSQAVDATWRRYDRIVQNPHSNAANRCTAPQLARPPCEEPLPGRSPPASIAG